MALNRFDMFSFLFTKIFIYTVIAVLLIPEDSLWPHTFRPGQRWVTWRVPLKTVGQCHKYVWASALFMTAPGFAEAVTTMATCCILLHRVLRSKVALWWTDGERRVSLRSFTREGVAATRCGWRASFSDWTTKYILQLYIFHDFIMYPTLSNYFEGGLVPK